MEYNRKYDDVISRMDFKLLATMIVAKKMIGFVGVGHRHLLRFNSNKNRVELNSQFLQGSKKVRLFNGQVILRNYVGISMMRL